MSTPLSMMRSCRIEDASRDFDLEFWQRSGPEAIFNAAWEMVVFAAELHGEETEDSNFAQLLYLLKQHEVRYLVIGGYAVMRYTEPRYTKDLDLWVDAERENCERLYRALAEFGAPLKDTSPADFMTYGMVHQIGVAPVRVDILTSLQGMSFPVCLERRKSEVVRGQPMHFLSLDDLIENKRRTGRPQDRIDVDALEKVRKL